MFGLYRTVRLIGKGGMGSVYEAIHTQIQRRAAIKVLSKALAGDRKVATRFMNEARAVNIVSHPAMVTVSDFGEQDGVPFIVMEFLEGETLHERMRSLRGRAMPLLSAAQIIRQIASGLDAAHSKGIIHRDLKPQNIMLVPDPETQIGERVKILDFGIAKFLDVAGPEQQFLTNASGLLGTPMYMSPEQCRNAREVTDRSDVYSLGILAYQLMSGAQPFRGGTDMEIILEHATATPMPMREIEPGIPLDIDELVLAMMNKQPSLRPNARQIVHVLANLLRTQSVNSGSIPIPEGLSRSQSMASLPSLGEPRERSASSFNSFNSLNPVGPSGASNPVIAGGSVDDPDDHGNAPTLDAPAAALAMSARPLHPSQLASGAPPGLSKLEKLAGSDEELEKTAISAPELERTAISDEELERTAISAPELEKTVAGDGATALDGAVRPEIKPPPGLELASTMPLSKLPNLNTAETMPHRQIDLSQQLAAVKAKKTSKALIVLALLITLAAVAVGLIFHFDVRF
jgi:serine/threonine protein kinase